MAFCPQCGTPLADGVRFCKGCGARQFQPQAPEAPRTPEPSYTVPEPSYAPVTPPVQTPSQFPGTAVKAAKGGASLLKWLIPLVAVALAVAAVVAGLEVVAVAGHDSCANNDIRSV